MRRVRYEGEGRLDEMTQKVYGREGHEKLWGWFGLDRASFLIMPRVLMHEMPDEWQAKMAALLSEYDATFSNWPDDWGCRAQLTINGHLAPTPRWLVNYRHPDRKEIDRLREKGDSTG